MLNFLIPRIKNFLGNSRGEQSSTCKVSFYPQNRTDKFFVFKISPDWKKSAYKAFVVSKLLLKIRLRQKSAQDAVQDFLLAII